MDLLYKILFIAGVFKRQTEARMALSPVRMTVFRSWSAVLLRSIYDEHQDKR